MTPLVQVTTHPFGACGIRPRQVLESGGFDVRYNPFGRRLKTHEVLGVVRDASVIVAGTEPYPPDLLDQVPDLQAICRVGVGLDNLDLQYCRDRGIEVTYTPEAPADGVAELTLAHILSLLRFVHQSDRSVRQRAWNRYLGFLLREKKIGLLGVGRIGSRVARLLKAFGTTVLGCDIEPNQSIGGQVQIDWVSMEALFAGCDLVSVHVPLTPANRMLVGPAQIAAMADGSFLVNTSRGGVVDEQAVLDALKSGKLAGAALDVFAQEPYEGPLARQDNVILTAHMGASAHASRYLMELGAAEDCVRLLRGQPPRCRAFDDASVSLRPRPAHGASGSEVRPRRKSSTG